MTIIKTFNRSKQNLKNIFFRLMYCREEQKIAALWLSRMKKAAETGRQGWEDMESRSLIDEMESRAQQAERGLDVVRLDYLRILNKELDSGVDADGIFKTIETNPDLAKSIVWAMELRPELKSEIYKAQMDAIAVNLALSRRSPTVHLGASYDFVGSEFPLKTTSWETSLSVHFPLAYDFWTQIVQKRAEQRQGDLKRAELQDRVRLEVRQAWETLMFWQKESRKREIAWAEMESRYDAMAKTPSSGPAAMRAMLSMYEMNRRYLEGVREQLAARVNFEWATGHDLSSE